MPKVKIQVVKTIEVEVYECYKCKSENIIIARVMGIFGHEVYVIMCTDCKANSHEKDYAYEAVCNWNNLYSEG